MKTPKPRPAPRTAPRTVLRTVLAWCAALTLPFVSGLAPASDVPLMSKGYRFDQTDGKALYAASCQGCHMAKGQGAAGAGSYPRLAGNPKLESAHYIAYRVVNGYRAMPPFGEMMNDDQIAAVVNYVQSTFAGGKQAGLTAAEIKQLRQ